MGIVVLAALIAYIFVLRMLIRASQKIGPWSLTRLGRVIAGTVTFILVNAVVFSPVLFAKLNRMTFDRLCDTQTDAKIYSRIETYGFFTSKYVRPSRDRSFQDYIASGQFTLVEYDQGKKLNGSRYVRVYVAPADDHSCVGNRPKISAFLIRSANDAIAKYPEFPKDRCLAVTWPKATNAPVGLIEVFEPYGSKDKIRKYSYFVLDRFTGRVLAEQNKFLLYSGHAYSVDHFELTCPRGSKFIEELFNTTLLASKSDSGANRIPATGAGRPLEYSELLTWAETDDISIIQLAMREPGPWVLDAMLENGFDARGVYNILDDDPEKRTRTTTVDSLLRFALSSNRVDLAKVLIEQGARFDDYSGDREENLFVFVAQYANSMTLRYLLEEGRWNKETLKAVSERVARYGDSAAEVIVLLENNISPNQMLSSALYDKTASGPAKVRVLVEAGGKLYPRGKPIRGVKYALENGTDEMKEYLRDARRRR